MRIKYLLFISVILFSCKQSASIKYSNELKIIGELRKKHKTDNEVDPTCDNWEISKDEIENIFLKMKLHNNKDISHLKLCYYLNCHYYESFAMYKNEKYTITIYPASYITLKNKHKILYFILESESDEFIEACDCCEDRG